jgi:hypothetical protein
MIPTTVILDKIPLLLSTDATTLAHATLGVKVALAKAAFTPGPNLLIGALTPANFTGSTPKTAATGAQQNFADPSTQQRVVQLQEPAGGWHWQASDILQLPQTIYGYYCTDNAGLIVYGSALLPQPVTINQIGDAVDIGQVRFSFSPTTPT